MPAPGERAVIAWPAMIAFVSIFLQLVTGAHPVELAVSGPVAAVELRLDGRLAGVLRGEPWTLECDLGAELSPHELVAVGYDGDGREVARAEQWINLPRPRSQVELVPEAGTTPRNVRLLWQSVDGAQPDAVAVSFDGRPLEPADPRRVELPPYDPAVIHLLRAELAFGPSVARAELLVGGPAGEVIGSDLTALPVPAAGVEEPPAGASPTEPPAGADGPRHLVVFVDTRRLRMAHRRPLVAALRQELAGEGPPPWTMLVTFDGAVTVRQEFTRDRDRVLAALADVERQIGGRPQAVDPGDQRLADEMAAVQEEFRWARRIADPQARQAALAAARAHRDAVLTELRFHGEGLRREIRATVEVLQRFAASLGAVEGRKALLYVGDQLTLAPARELYAVMERYAGSVELDPRELARLVSEAGTLHTGRDFDQLVREANGNGVTFYTLTPPSPYHPGRVESASAGLPGVQLVLRDERSAGVREAACLLSHDTGGLCQVEGSEAGLLLAQAVADFATAYSLAYTPERPADGELHSIEVKVKRRDLRLRHREGYLAKPRQDRLRDRLTAALLFGAETDALGMELALAAPEPVGEDRYVLPLEVRLPIARLGLLPTSEPGVFRAQLRLLLAVAGGLRPPDADHRRGGRPPGCGGSVGRGRTRGVVRPASAGGDRRSVTGRGTGRWAGYEPPAGASPGSTRTLPCRYISIRRRSSCSRGSSPCASSSALSVVATASAKRSAAA
jgi:VWFA-related protein